MGAKIKADGIMGPRTRAAIQKFMKKKKTSASPIMSKKTSSIKTTTSKFGCRISMSARLKEIDKEKKAKGKQKDTMQMVHMKMMELLQKKAYIIKKYITML